MTAATDLRRPLILSIAGNGLTHTFADDNSPSHHVLTINDHVGFSQSGIRINQDSTSVPDDLSRMEENPYAILGSDGFAAPGSSTVDPFRNQTPKIQGVYEWVKMVVCVPIALVRLVLFGLCLLIGYVATKFALYGWKDKQNPMPRWRCRVIYVNRFSYQSRKQAVNEIKRKASGNRYPRVLLFPEGTTTNGRQLISFQLGAFLPGYPIQPVVIRYPHLHFDQSWGHIALATLMFRMFMQFHNFMEVEYLPVISPSKHFKESPARFAERTGRAMASALNVVQTYHSFADYALLSKAVEAGHENLSPFMVEMAQVQKLYHLSSSEAVDFLERFLAMNPDSSGCVQYQDFIRVLRLKHSRLSENIFGFVDANKNGVITFKEFLVGSIHILKLPLFQRACDVTFIESDENKDHYVSLSEFGGSISPMIPDLATSEIQALFELFDNDGDGKISKDDFNTCLRRNPLLIAHFNHHFMHKVLDAETSKEEMV
ncbi:hypothetical protein E3N88_37054 [Mikania micrantha]|uniref:EF-hand domain-containing protein n=1 Tax=Mikania micrantha TaxID=192012 RepID=A0A5N6M5K0_9ASTR|nr:hypothetical protein E3N88_37054 [Mikania micrantha]